MSDTKAHTGTGSGKNVPEKLGHYDIKGELGKGGMGTVYKAYETSLNRHVALKVLSPHLADDASLAARFVREAQSVAALSHPNVVHIYYAGTDQGQPFFVMEYVEGDNLADHIRRNERLAPKEAAEFLLQAASGISAAHDRGIVHRDIKPSNLMISANGTLKVTDFGIALAQDFKEKLTSTGQLVGTSGYISPEACRGQAVDARSDIFSLGIVLYEMLSGRLPFDDNSPLNMMVKVVKEAAPDVRALNPEVDERLLAILDRMIEKEPDDRYQTCHDLVSDLKDYLAGKEKPAVAASARTPATDGATVHMKTTESTPQPPPTRKPRRWPAVLFVLVAVGALGAGGWWGWQEYGPVILGSEPESVAARSTASPYPSRDSESAPAAIEEAAESEEPVTTEESASGSGTVTDSDAGEPSRPAGEEGAPGDPDPVDPGQSDAPALALASPEPAAAGDTTTTDSPASEPEVIPAPVLPAEESTPVAEAPSDAGTAESPVEEGGGSPPAGDAPALAEAARPGDTAGGSRPSPSPAESAEDTDGEDSPGAQPEPLEVAEATVEPAPRPSAPAEPQTPRVAVIAVGDPAIAGPVQQRINRELADTDYERMDVEMLPGYRSYLDEYSVDVAGLGELVREQGGTLLVVASITPTGDTPLHYYGRSDWLYNARLDVKGYDLDAGRSVGGELSSDLSYTGLNAREKAEDAVAPLAARLAEAVRGIEAPR